MYLSVSAVRCVAKFNRWRAYVIPNGKTIQFIFVCIKNVIVLISGLHVFLLLRPFFFYSAIKIYFYLKTNQALITFTN